MRILGLDFTFWMTVWMLAGLVVAGVALGRADARGTDLSDGVGIVGGGIIALTWPVWVPFLVFLIIRDAWFPAAPELNRVGQKGGR